MTIQNRFIFAAFIIVSYPFESRAEKLQAEWNAIANQPRVAAGDGKNNFLFEIGHKGDHGTIRFLETPGPNNWGAANLRTTTDNVNPAVCNPAAPACNAATKEQCVDARWLLAESPVAVPQPDYRCVAGTALIYTQLLQRIEQCGATCMVDVSSLSNPTAVLIVPPMIGAAAAAWAIRHRNQNDARLYIRFSEGFAIVENMASELEQLDQFLDPAHKIITKADLAKMKIVGVPLTKGATLGGGAWSHAKLFAVLDATDEKRSFTMLGGQNHWNHYFQRNRPFDANVVLEGPWARTPSYAMDGAISISGAAAPLYYVYKPGGILAKGAADPTGGVSAKTILGNPIHILVNVAKPEEHIISLFDMGDYSRNDSDRTILKSLGTVTQIQHPEKDANNIFAWVQSFCGEGGNCGGRHRIPDTFVRRVAEHVVNPAEIGVASSKIRLLQAGNSETLSRYGGGSAGNALGAFQANAAWTACVPTNRFGRDNMRGFATPANHHAGAPAIDYSPIQWGNANCKQSAYRAVFLRTQLRTARADDGTGKFVAAGEHHKVYVFDHSAFVGSFNPYPSALVIEQDSKLIENGLWFFDQPTIDSVLSNGNTAWSAAFNQWGAPGNAGGTCSASFCNGCAPLRGCGWCADDGTCRSGGPKGPNAGQCQRWAFTSADCN